MNKNPLFFFILLVWNTQWAPESLRPRRPTSYILTAGRSYHDLISWHRSRIQNNCSLPTLVFDCRICGLELHLCTSAQGRKMGYTVTGSWRRRTGEGRGGSISWCDATYSLRRHILSVVLSWGYKAASQPTTPLFIKSYSFYNFDINEAGQ